MSIGLDLDLTQFRSLRVVGGELVGRQCRAVYAVLADTASHRRLLRQSSARFAECGQDLVLFGDSALEWADILNLPVTALLPGGRVPQGDPVARQILTLMIDAVLPPAERLGDVCCLTIPGGHDISQAEQPYDVRFFQQLVALRGYHPKLISPGHAVVLAELESASFSGIGICFDAGLCHVAVVHCGRELARCSFDECLVEQSTERVEAPSIGLAAKVASVDAPLQTGRDLALRQALSETLIAARDEFDRQDVIRWLAQPTHVVYTGRSTSFPDFASLFAEVWSSLKWPMQVAQLHVASNAVYSIARGCLIQSQLENRVDRSRAA